MRLKLTLNNEQKLFFTSDTHYGHINICLGESEWPFKEGLRNFPTVEKMNATIVANINNTVKQDDILICQGDWSFGGFENIKKFRDQLHCRNIHFIFGNHDEHIEANRDNVQELFTTVSDILKLEVKILREFIKPQGSPYSKVSIQCCHFPIASWESIGRYHIHLHGHLHTPGNLKVHECRAMDVGMDGHPEFRPYEIREIMKLMSDKPISNLKLRHDRHIEGHG